MPVESHGTKSQNNELGKALLQIARHAIADEFGIGHPADPTPEDFPELGRPGATFVTLTSEGNLRGCIGTLVAARPLIDDVRSNAFSAAFRDSRFAPLAPNEFEQVRVEVSLLSPSTRMSFQSETDFLRQLRPGEDGVILEYGAHRSTFLPQVWATLPQPRKFIEHLKLKAGLSADFWNDSIRLSRYTVTKWQE